jgi:hypothetical protein
MDNSQAPEVFRGVQPIYNSVAGASGPQNSNKRNPLIRTTNIEPLNIIFFHLSKATMAESRSALQSGQPPPEIFYGFVEQAVRDADSLPEILEYRLVNST